MKNIRNLICLLFIAANATLLVVVPAVYYVHTRQMLEDNVVTLRNFYRNPPEGLKGVALLFDPAGINADYRQSIDIVIISTALIALMLGLNFLVSIAIYRLSGKVSKRQASKQDFSQLIKVSVVLLISWFTAIAYYMAVGSMNALGKELIVSPLVLVILILQPFIAAVILVLSIWILLTLAGQNKELADENSLIV